MFEPTNASPAKLRAVSAGDRAAHSQALLLAGRCPNCAERLDARSLFGARPCPACEGQVEAELSGTPLAAQVRARGRRQLIFIALGVGVAHLTLGVVPLLGALVLVGAAAWIRVGILQPASAMLSARRRVLTRWTARLIMAICVALTVVTTEALTFIPVFGPIAKSIISAGEVALVAGAVTRYVHWQVDREAAGERIAGWEWGLLLACGLALVAALVLVALAFVALASAYDTALGWLR